MPLNCKSFDSSAIMLQTHWYLNFSIEFYSLNTDSPEIAQSSPRLLSRYLSLFITLGVLLIILLKVNVAELFSAIARVGFGTGILLILLYALGQLISAMKWRILLNSGGVVRSIAEVVRAYFAGMFINSFGLGTVGGDLARALALKPRKGQRTATLASVAADRVHGLTVLLSIGVLGACLSQTFLGQEELQLLGSFAVVLAVCSWLFGPKVLMSLSTGDGRVPKTLRMIAGAFPSSPLLLVRVSLLATLVHVLQISMHILIANSLGISIPLMYFFAIVPLVNIVSCLPVSIQGIGVREGLYLLLLTPLGVENELAVALGVIWVLVLTSVSLLSGLILSSPLAGWSFSGFYRSLQRSAP